MPIPFDMIAVMLFLGFYVYCPDSTPPSIPHSLLVLAGFAAGLSLATYLINRAALAFARRRTMRFGDRRQAAATAEYAARIVLALVYAMALTQSSFPWSVSAAFGLDPADALFPQLTGLAVYFLFFVCGWLPLYGLHREITPGQWNIGSFLLHKARYNLYMLVAWIPFAVLSEWLSEVLIVLPLLVIAAAWTFPYILAKLWGCTPLQSETLLGLVEQLQKETKTSVSKVLIWEPGGGRMQNAAAVGILPPFRYLFLTPALIENMNLEELRGVILHELGHVKKRHLLFYMFTTLACVNSALLIGEMLPLKSDIEMFAVVTLLVLFYFRFVFGWLSRTMERQADLFALETTRSPAGLISALERLGISAGNVRNVYSWHHLGIAERTSFLRHAASDPRLAERHNRRARAMMLTGYILSFALLLGLGLAAQERMLSSPPRPDAGQAVATAHWKRVMQLLPKNAVGPLELAYQLSADPAARDEAVSLAAKAMDLTAAKEEREAAEKLIENLTRGAP